MGPILRLLKLLHLFLFGMGVCLILPNILTTMVEYFFSTPIVTIPSNFQNFMMRITIYSVALMYLHLYEKKGTLYVSKIRNLYYNNPIHHDLGLIWA
jgi:hypothetical protein